MVPAFLYYLFCSLCNAQTAQNLLQNPDLIFDPLNTFVVPRWNILNARVSRVFLNGSFGAKIEEPLEGLKHCSQLRQAVNTTINETYQLSCLAYSDHWVNGEWAHGLMVTTLSDAFCTSLFLYINISWFSQTEEMNNLEWKNVSLIFTATDTITQIVLHSDHDQWACYRNCSLVSLAVASPTSFSPTSFSPTSFSPTSFSPTSFSPTSFSPTSFSPTSFPTAVPSFQPAQQPSLLRPPCVNCILPACSSMQVSGEQTQCDNLSHLLQTISYAKNITAAGDIRVLLCRIVAFESRTYNNCHHFLDANLYRDSCVTLRENLFKGFLPRFNSRWCFNSTEDFPDQFSTSSNLQINYTQVTNKQPCLEQTQKYQPKNNAFLGDGNEDASSSQLYTELGPLADVVANPQSYPDFPPIKKLQISQTTEILFNTQCLETQAVSPIWYTLLSVFLLLAIISCVALSLRGKRQPLRSRDPFLLWGSCFWIVVNFVWISIDQLTGNTASCGLISFGNLVAFPLLLFTYLLRALRLLFLYKWSESKINKKQRWFHAHRYLVSAKCFSVSLGIFLMICLVIFIATNVVDQTFTQTFISSGRCEWWDLNQQVIEAASQAGVALLPTDFNPNGFVPFSVEYSSCIFCSTFTTQVLMCVLTVILLAGLMVALCFLRKINDQFKLWFELVGVLVILCIVAVVRSIMFFPSAATSMMRDVGSDLSALFLAIGLFLILLLTTAYPVCLTYSKRYVSTSASARTSSKISTMDGEISVNGRIVTLSLEEVLNDTFCLNLFRRFALESFAVENVMYWVNIKEFERLPLDNQVERGEAAVKIYDTFLRQNSVMEVNIEAPMREKYDAVFGVSPENGASFWAEGTTSITTGGASLETMKRQEGNLPRAPSDLSVDAFQDVSKVVFSLMLTNDWLRFKQSPLWNVLGEEMKKRAKDSNPLISEGGTQMSDRSSSL